VCEIGTGSRNESMPLPDGNRGELDRGDPRPYSGPATCEENSGVKCAIEGCFFPASDKLSISERARNGIPLNALAHLTLACISFNLQQALGLKLLRPAYSMFDNLDGT